MADVIVTKMGTSVISNTGDMLDLVEECIGVEARDMLDAWLEDVDGEKAYAEMKFNSDFAAMEGEVENYRDVLFDVKSEIEIILDKMDRTKSKTIGKNAFDVLYTQLDTIDTMITKEL